MTPKTEAWVKKRVKMFLSANNIYYFMPSAGKFGRAGVPDFICCYKGKMIGIETKTKGKVPTPLQEVEMLRIQNAGGMTFVIYEDNLHELGKILEC